MNVHVAFKDTVAVVALEGNLFGGAETIPLCNALRELHSRGHHQVILDMTKVTWVSISGMGMLMSALTSVRSHKGDLYLAGASSGIQEQLQKARLDQILKHFDHVDSAVAASG